MQLSGVCVGVGVKVEVLEEGVRESLGGKKGRKVHGPCCS